MRWPDPDAGVPEKNSTMNESEAPPLTEPILTTIIVKTQHPGVRREEERAHYLVMVEGEGTGLRIELGSKAVVLGRAEPAEVVVPDPQVSRRHCRVGMVLEELLATDLESSNGTFVDGKRISGTVMLPVGARLRLGSHVFEHEWRARKEVQADSALDRDIDNASRYVMSLVPPPITEGPVRTEWLLLPSTRLGGDVLGYRFIDPDRFAIYLLDVSGHGTGPAMHAVSVFNVLRGGAMPGIDPADPARVVAGLNTMFQMRNHGGLYLTIWYGVYDLKARSLAYCSAGHHQSILVPPGRQEAMALRLPNLAIGIVPNAKYAAGRVDVAPGSSLYLFSDGVFEIDRPDGSQWTIEGLTERIVEPPAPGVPETQRILAAARAVSRDPDFEDDFSIVVATFA